MKKPGKKQSRLIEPRPFVLAQKPRTVKELLTSLTELGAEQYQAGKDDGTLLSCLTKQEIDEQAARGKITVGFHGGADVVPEKAVANTLQCFEDGIYRVFAGETELTALSEEIPWTENLVFTFIRLTMLSGW